DRSGATSPPQPGDVMVFTGADDAGHVGIVETVTGTTVQTIEGNSGDKVQRNTYNYQTDPTVLGWGRMK
ncbi:MAG TPA: CHAP domain-containing protein, partial [Candidatus Saccharimonadales bacterium]|nr:CHAP domain-containing protein [Candidatus Saccharimonadales bacterium]